MNEPPTWLADLPILASDLPILHEDEGLTEMGESIAHTRTGQTLHIGISAHLVGQAELRVYADLNLYYHGVQKWAYVSPDIMVVAPASEPSPSCASYRIGKDGPAPLLVIEVLSVRSLQQHDLTIKPLLYAQIGVAELIFVDPTGEYLPQRLQLRRLQPDESWLEIPEDDSGGIRSQLGFTLLIEPDHRLRVIHTQTRQGYPRPEELTELLSSWQAAMDSVQAANEARFRAEDRLRALENSYR